MGTLANSAEVQDVLSAFNKASGIFKDRINALELKEATDSLCCAFKACMESSKIDTNVRKIIVGTMISSMETLVNGSYYTTCSNTKGVSNHTIIEDINSISSITSSIMSYANYDEISSAKLSHLEKKSNTALHDVLNGRISAPTLGTGNKVKQINKNIGLLRYKIAHKLR